MSIAAKPPVCRIIAGPNGAGRIGKATFALRYLPQVAPGSAFVNANLIAAGLRPASCSPSRASNALFSTPQISTNS